MKSMILFGVIAVLVIGIIVSGDSLVKVFKAGVAGIKAGFAKAVAAVKAWRAK